MKEINILLENRWVLRRQEPELYYQLKDKFDIYKDFFKEKLGYRVIVNPYMIKVEKTPGSVETWMGIQEFDSIKEYVFLCLILMFLEEREAEEQFILSNITEFIQNSYIGEEKIDWTVFKNRKSLIKVLKYCQEQGLIIANDGSENEFSTSGSTEVLYENTGVSKYFVRRFTTDISEYKNYKDFMEGEWQYSDKERGIIRRHRVYRRILMSPVVYNEGVEDQDYMYIKTQRSYLENDMDKYLNAQLHIHKNCTMLMMNEQADLKDAFPNRKNIADIVLLLNSVITNKVKKSEIQLEINGSAIISEIKWNSIISNCIEENKDGFSKQYREADFKMIKNEIEQFMTEFNLVKLLSDKGEVVLLPAIGKIVGEYPKDYKEKMKSEKQQEKEAVN